MKTLYDNKNRRNVRRMKICRSENKYYYYHSHSRKLQLKLIIELITVIIIQNYGLNYTRWILRKKIPFVYKRIHVFIMYKGQVCIYEPYFYHERDHIYKYAYLLITTVILENRRKSQCALPRCT